LNYSIVSSKTTAHLLDQFHGWVEDEWGPPDSASKICDDIIIPNTLLAVADEKLIAGLGFSGYPAPGSEKAALWINTLLVAASYRQLGIGSRLVTEAENEAASLGHLTLFVYSDVPELYQKLNWVIADDSNESTVLKKQLPVSRAKLT
jgi:GNAT superfamily N-acetyltransferase